MMKMNVLKFILPITLLMFLFACEKDSEIFVDDPQITQTTEFSLQAEELLAQLPQEGLDMLSSDDIATFKRGPNISTRSQASPYASWYPILGMFYCDVGVSNTSGEGMWMGYGLSTIELDLVPDPLTGYSDGNVVMTSEALAKLMGPFEAKKYHKWQQGKHKQLLKATFEAGTQIFFMPEGKMNMHVLFQPGEEHPIIILVEGWVEYGLADPPVPLEFEEHFPFDALYEHYIGLKTIPDAEPMYVTTFNEFWLYPTEVEGVIAAPGIGQGEWLGNGPVTFTVDQTILGDYGTGRWRLYTGQGPDYQLSEYMDFCHTHALGPPGGTWPFELVGGTESYFNYGGRGTGVWIGMGDPNAIFGNIPDNPLLLPPDMKDDGLTCAPYGSTDCVGYCVPGGPGVNTLVYIIGYKYPLGDYNCMSVGDDGLIEYSPMSTIILPTGQTFTGTGVLPGEITIGPYSGMISSAGYKQFMTPIGQMTLGVSLFDAGGGNAFWMSNIVIGFPISPTQFQLIQKHSIVGGTGDFAEVRGILRIGGVLDVTTSTITYDMTGEMCL